MSIRSVVVTAVAALASVANAAADPSVVGYPSASNGAYGPARVCDFPATLSTSGSFAQCCAATGPCPFFTACTGNTLFAGSTSVSCDDQATLTCNTAILAPTAGASSGPANLACWQKTLGSSAFTLIRDIGSATVLAASSPTSGASIASSTGSSASTAGSGSGSSSPSSSSGSGSGNSAAASTSKGGAAGMDTYLVGGGGMLAALLAVVQALL